MSIQAINYCGNYTINVFIWLLEIPQKFFGLEQVCLFYSRLHLLKSVYLKHILKAVIYFKSKQKTVWGNAFSSCKKYVYSESAFTTLYIETTQKSWKKYLSNKINSAKCALFFFRELQLMSWSTMFVSLKLCMGFPFSTLFRY